MEPNLRSCPLHIRLSLDRYAIEHIECGHFLTAVLENDLFEAVGRADSENLEVLPHICAYVYNILPATCHGSKEKVQAYLAERETLTDDARERTSAQMLSEIESLGVTFRQESCIKPVQSDAADEHDGRMEAHMPPITVSEDAPDE